MALDLTPLDGERVGGLQVKSVIEDLLLQIDSTGNEGALVDYNGTITYTPSSGTHTSTTKTYAKYQVLFGVVHYWIDYSFTQSTASAYALNISLPFNAVGANFTGECFLQNITDSTLDRDVSTHLQFASSIQVYKNSQFASGKAFRLKIHLTYEKA